MAPNIEGYDQATVIPQCVINRLISQHASLAAPEELHFEDEHGSGLSDVVAGIPQVIIDVEGENSHRVLLVLPLLSGQLRIRANTNPDDRTAIEYVVKDWQLAFTVHVESNPDTTPNPKYQPTQKALKVQKEYTKVHDSLKTEYGITIWDWLMRLGASKYDPVDTRFSTFGHWSDEDFHLSEDGTYVPATQRFALGSQRKWPIHEPVWFQRFAGYLDQFGRQLWQTITLGIFQHVAAKPIASNVDSQKPAPPVTGLHVQQYPYLDSSMSPRTGVDHQSRFNAVCFLEIFQGRSPPEPRAIPWQGNWVDGEYGVHQFSLFRIMSPFLSRWNYILLQAKQQTTPIAADWELRDLPRWCEFTRYQGSETDNIEAMLRGRSPNEVEFWKRSETGHGPLPSNALVWTCDSPTGQGFNTRHEEYTGYLSLFSRLSFVPGSNQMYLDTRLLLFFKNWNSRTWQTITWARVGLNFGDGQDELTVKVQPPDLHNVDKFTLDLSVPLNAEQIAKANGELDKLRAETENAPLAAFSHGGPVLSRHGLLQATRYSDTESAERICQLKYPHVSLSVCHIPDAGPHNIPPNATIAAATRDPNTIEIWWVATDGSVQGAYFYDGGTWQRYTLAGPGSAAPNAICATSCDPLRIDVFWIAPDGTIRGSNFHRARDPSWSPPMTIRGRNPGLLPGTIEAVTWAPGCLAVFWTGKSTVNYNREKGGIEGSFSTKDGEWIPRTVMSVGGVRPTNSFKAIGRTPEKGFDLVEACSNGEMWSTSPRLQPTVDLPETFTPHTVSSPSSIPASCRFAIGSHGDGHLAYWHTTPSGGIVGAQKSQGGEWKKENVAPDDSIASGGSLQAASREPGKIELLWISPTGVLKGCSSIADVLSTPSYTLRDDPVAAPESPLTVICRRQGTLDVFFRAPSGHLVAGIVNYD